MKKRIIHLVAIVQLMLFIFPLLFAHHYSYPSFALNYRFLSIGLVLSWFLCYLFGGRSYLDFRVNIERFLNSNTKLGFSLLLIFLCAVYLYSVIDSYRSFGLNAIDFSYFNELIPNTLQGKWMHSNAYGGNHFGVHSTWIMLLLTPLYLVVKSPYLLVTAHAFILIGTAFPLKRILESLNLRIGTKYFFIFAFFFSSYMAQILNYNFHVENFMVPLFLWLYYYIDKNDYGVPFWGVLILSLMIKEDVAFYMLGASLIVFRNSRKNGLAMALLCFLVAIINLKLVIPANRDSSSYSLASTASAYGQTFGAILSFALAHPFVIVKDILSSGWKKLLLPYLGLPVVSLYYWGVAGVAILVHAMALSPFMKNLGLYYSAPFISASVFSFLMVVKSRPRLFANRETVTILSGVLLLLLGNGKIVLERSHPYYQEFEIVASKIQNQRVCAQASLYPHLPQSNDLSLLSNKCLTKDYDYFILSNTTQPYPFTSDEIIEMRNELAHRSGLKHFQVGDLHFFKRIDQRSENESN